MNENGFTNLSGVLFCLILISWGTIFLKKKMSLMQENNSKMKVLLCSKNLNGAVKQYTKNILSSNNALKTLTISKKAVNFIPGIGKLIGEISVKAAIQIVKAKQEFHYGEFTARVLVGAKNKCYKPNINKYKTFTNKRNHFNELIAKGKSITYKVRNKKWLITTKVYISRAKTSSKLQRALLY